MPMYEYRCASCGTEFSKRLKISDRNDPIDSECPECNAESGSVQMMVGTPLVSYSQNPGIRTTDNFNDRMKEMKRRVGNENTLSDIIR